MFDNIWKRLIKMNPRMILNYSGYNQYDRERMIKYALDNGYTVTEEDLRKSKYLTLDDQIKKKAIEINPLYIKYFIFDYSKGIITSEIDKEIEEIITTHHIDGEIYSFNSFFGNLFRKYPWLLVATNGGNEYASFPDEELVRICLDSGYVPRISDIKDHKKLSCSDTLFKILIDQDVNNVRYYCSSSEEIFKYALDKGYVPRRNDLHNRNFASSYSIMMKLLDKDASLIEKYTGEIQEVYDYAISKGYTLTPQKYDRLMSARNINKSDSIMSQIIAVNPNYIYNYRGSNERVFELAYSKMTKEDIDKLIEHIKQNKYQAINSSAYIFRKLIDGDESKGLLPNMEMLNYYERVDIDLFKYAFSKGFVPNEMLLNERQNNIDFYLALLEVYPELYIHFKSWYSDRAIDIFNIIADKGYCPSEEILDQISSIRSFSSAVEKYIKKYPQLIKYYSGDNSELYISAIQQGYVPSDDVIEKKDAINKSFAVMFELVLRDPRYFQYYKDSSYVYKDVLKFVATRNPSDMPIFIPNDIAANARIMEFFIDIDISNLAKLVPTKDNIHLIEKAILEQNYYLDINYYIGCFGLLSFEVQKLIVEKYPSIIEASYVPIINVELYLIAQSKGFKPHHHFTVEIFDFIANPTDFSIIKNNPTNTTLFRIAIQYFNYKPDYNDINEYNIEYVTDETLEELMEKMNLDQLIHVLFCCKHLDDMYPELRQKAKKIWDRIYKLTNTEISFQLYAAVMSNVNSYSEEDIKLILLSFPSSDELKEDFSFTLDDIIKYAPAYLSSIVDIYKDKEFINVKNYFVKCNCLKIGGYVPTTIKSVIKLFDSYSKNPGLYKMIIENDMLNGEKRKEILSSLDFISAVGELSFDINSVEKLINAKELYIQKYKKDIQYITSNEIAKMKNIVCNILFGTDFIHIQKRLEIYGNTEDLRILLFNNRHNKEIHDDILEMLTLVSYMQSIVDNNNFDDLKEIANNALLNYDKTFETLSLFSKFDEKMRRLYEKELAVNTTKIKDAPSDELEGIIDKDMTSRCGVDVIDLTGSQYCLIEHCVSSNEDIGDLANGIDKSGMLTICLSIGSHRGQALYYGGGGGQEIIMATDSLPKGSFIRSSTSNMGSNGSVTDAITDEDSEKGRQQRGALEMSATSATNSEVLAFRNGVKFKYIVLLGGREPTKEEIELAKKYGLKFVKVQALSSKIDNPKKMDPKYLEESDSRGEEQRESSEKFINALKGKPQKDAPRRIAIFTDAHALFEPTLAILEDARKNGITEIYSLGDNIGTGPSPREVLDLLREYGVESIQGNHELYALGIDKLSSELQSHLDATGARGEATRNSAWTRSQLTEEQLHEISQYPTDRVIEVGGKKIYLTHYSKTYDDKDKSIPEGIDKVLQGHVHFASDSHENGVDLTTVRGVGIGDESRMQRASYVIVTETEDGYRIEVREVRYNSSNLYHTINESDMDKEDKNKIEGWSGFGR